MFSRISRWIGVAACATILTATAVQAQDAPTRQRNRVMRSDSTERIAERQYMAARQTVVALARRLELNERQVNALRVAVEGAADEAGAGWRIAALLQRELTKEQKALLFEQAGRAAAFQAGIHFGRRRQAGQPGARGMGQAKRDRADAMADALGLTESQRELMRIHRAIGVAAATRMSVQAGYRDRISSR